MSQIFSLAQDYIVERVTVDPVTHCWNWNKAKNVKGYGVCKFRLIEGINSSHRLSYSAFNERLISQKDFVCHKCDNPSCCNPDHLWLGDAKENAQDRVKKERFVGQNASTAIYDDSDIDKVVELRLQGLSSYKISELTGMSINNIMGILNGKRRPSYKKERPQLDLSKTYSDEVVQQIIQLRKDFVTLKKISEITGVSLPQVKNIVYGRQRGQEPIRTGLRPARGESNPNFKINNEMLAQIQECIDNGESFRSIGRKFDVSKTMVANIAYGKRLPSES